MASLVEWRQSRRSSLLCSLESSCTLSSTLFARRIDALSQPGNGCCLDGTRRGIEKEGLRVTPDLQVSRRSHPARLGAALTHPAISTDFSEAQLELITPTFPTPDAVLQCLEEIHGQAAARLEADECLWNASMPPPLKEGDADIAIAHYGSSHLGKLKHLYRQGLGYRYGRAMQAISGIHYNLSLDDRFWQLLHQLDGSASPLIDYQSAGYFALIRNFHRYSWLLAYMFGASPALDSSFLQGQDGGLDRLDADTLFLPWSTSLRLSDIGYSTAHQAGLSVSWNSLEGYTRDLWQATRTPRAVQPDRHPTPGEGVHQLNDNILQAENEYYGVIRPKRTTEGRERPAVALRRRGVEYIEVRCLDINPLMPLGLDSCQIHFMDVFLVFCALLDSPDFSAECTREAAANLKRSCLSGRESGLLLQEAGQPRRLQDWGLQLCTQMEPVAELLDSAFQTHAYTASLTTERRKLDTPELTPSAQILDHIRREGSFAAFAHAQSLQHRTALLQKGLYLHRQEEFETMAVRSLEKQQALEADHSRTFEDYLSEYLHPEDTAGMTLSHRISKPS